jgi:predicted dehydrogenase
MVNLALVGSGYWGSKVAESLRLNPSVSKLQIIDVKNGDTIDDIDSDIRAAVIATPLWDHMATATALLERGFDCYIEKPMAETTAECEQLGAYSKDSIIMVGHIFVYHPALQYVKDSLSKIGTVKHILSERLNWGIYQTKTTPLLSLLPHDVSIIIDLLGEDIQVLGAGSTTFTDNIVPDWVSFDARVRDVTIRITGSWYWPERVRKLTIVGDQGSIVWDDNLNQVHVFQGQVNERRLTELTKTTHTPEMTKTPLQLELDHFIECVENRTQPRTDCRNAIAVAKVLDAVRAELGLDH